jgi:hypothetical protein
VRRAVIEIAANAVGQHRGGRITRLDGRHVENQFQGRGEREFFDRADDVLLGFVVQILAQERRRIERIEQRPQLAQVHLDQVNIAVTAIASRQSRRRPATEHSPQATGCRPR